MTRWLVAALVLGFAVSSGSPLRPPVAPRSALAPVLIIRVVEDASRLPLPNAEVIDLDSGTRRFTNDDGETRVTWPQEGRLRLRVRQLGYQFVDRELDHRTAPGADSDRVTIALQRVAYVMPDVTTRATNACATDGDAATKALSAIALGQLRMGAERYESFRKAYPFRIHQKRRTVRYLPDGKPREIREGRERASSDDWGERYRPGRVVDRSPAGFSVPLLFLAALGDSVFWAHHCFTVHGVETFGQNRVLRLAFTPAPHVETVDWMGTALLDSATSVLRRVEFQLAGLRPNDLPRRLEGFTTFRSPSPFIMIPDSTVAMWWRREVDASSDAWAGPDVVQLLQLLEVSYRKQKPPVGRGP